MLEPFSLIKRERAKSTLPKVWSSHLVWRSWYFSRTRCWSVSALADMLTHLPFLILICLLFLSSEPSLYHLYSGVGLPEASHFTISLRPSSTNTVFFIGLSSGPRAKETRKDMALQFVWGDRNTDSTNGAGLLCVIMFKDVNSADMTRFSLNIKIVKKSRGGTQRERKIQKSLSAGQMMSPETLAALRSLASLWDQCSTFTPLIKALHSCCCSLS